MNGEMMEYMVDRRGIPMDVLTRMKIEERLEFLPQTGKEEACICFVSVSAILYSILKVKSLMIPF